MVSYWVDDPERLAGLYSYCKQDVEAERALYRRVGFISDAEQAVWTLDQAINDRGVYIDDRLVRGAIRIDSAAHAEIDAELAMLTAGAITSCDQGQRINTWLAEHGCSVDNIQKATLGHALTRKDIPDVARQVLELRRDGAHAATSKFSTMLNWRAQDGRARGCFVYQGASTGRWASYGPQLHNLRKVPSGGVSLDAIAAVMGADFARLRELRPENPLGLVGEVARAALTAAPGNRLVIADFSGIESRVLAWIAGEKSKLEQWRKFDETGLPEDEPI